MFQGWCSLTFLHWPCDPGLLQTRLPPGLQIDTYEHTGWVGLTPFHLTGLRPPFLPPLPWLSRFPETNLRTYVRGPAGPGIWFFSLDAASAAAVTGARLAYGLPYYQATMRVRRAGSRIEYTSARSGAAHTIRVEIGAPWPDPDARTRFLTERYRLYAERRGALVTAAVEHVPWPLHHASLVGCEETLRRAAGLPGDGPPRLVHYSPGVRTRIGPPRRIARVLHPAPSGAAPAPR
jgi:uncharacterized protein YqjF (DUF2071 family)